VTYLLANCSCDNEYAEGPESLAIELTPKLLEHLQAAQQAVLNLTKAIGGRVSGVDMVNWGVRGLSVLLDGEHTQGLDPAALRAITGDYGSAALIDDAPETADSDKRIDVMGLRVDDTDVMLYGWTKYGGQKFITERIRIQALLDALKEKAWPTTTSTPGFAAEAAS